MTDPVLAVKPRCPVCRKDARIEFRPFCSRRCKDVDLHRWFSGSYSIPVVESDEEMGDGSNDPDATS